MPNRRELRVPKAVVCEVLDGEAVLLNLKTGVYFSLNKTGTRMWQALGTHGSFESALPELVRALAPEGQEARVRSDLEQLARELVSAGLLEVEDR